MKTKRIATVLVTILAIVVYLTPVAITKAENGPGTTTSSATGTTPVITPLAVKFMRITAYTSLPDETDSTPFITANGTHVRDGIVATNILPFGTEIEIPSLFGTKVFTVEDRMSPHFQNTIDIWMPTKGKALFFGLNYADVVIMSDPNKDISER
jgi:3D (Asp-Asp-Asp) domain-containing protein